MPVTTTWPPIFSVLTAIRPRPVYVIVGTPTPERWKFTDSNVVIREYELTRDPISDAPVPFFRDDAYGVVNEIYDNGDELLLALNPPICFLVESGDGDNVRKFQSWIHISGEGAAQKSAAFVYAGGMSEDTDGNLQMGGGRRGTFRVNAYEGPVNMRGGINTIAGATGEHFFGPNADHFVIGTSLDPADGFTDAPLDFDEVFTGNPADGYLGDGSPFSTTHVAESCWRKGDDRIRPTRTANAHHPRGHGLHRGNGRGL